MHKGPQAAFHEFLAAGRFMIQRCPASGRHEFYPRIVEPASGAPLEWVEASGLGSVYSVTIVRHKPPAPPYPAALIDLVEGPRLMSTVEGIAPTDIRIGMRVMARIIRRDGQALLVFEPVPNDEIHA